MANEAARRAAAENLWPLAWQFTVNPGAHGRWVEYRVKGYDHAEDSGASWNLLLQKQLDLDAALALVAEYRVALRYAVKGSPVRNMDELEVRAEKMLEGK